MCDKGVKNIHVWMLSLKACYCGCASSSCGSKPSTPVIIPMSLGFKHLNAPSLPPTASCHQFQAGSTALQSDCPRYCRRLEMTRITSFISFVSHAREDGTREGGWQCVPECAIPKGSTGGAFMDPRVPGRGGLSMAAGGGGAVPGYVGTVACTPG